MKNYTISMFKNLKETEDLIAEYDNKISKNKRAMMLALFATTEACKKFIADIKEDERLLAQLIEIKKEFLKMSNN